MTLQEANAEIVDPDPEVTEWLKTVTPEMYDVATAIRDMVIHDMGTKGKMIIANALEQYARAKWDEACKAQKQMIWNDLKIHVTTPNNVFGEVFNVTRVANATYEHAPKPEFKP